MHTVVTVGFLTVIDTVLQKWKSEVEYRLSPDVISLSTFTQVVEIRLAQGSKQSIRSVIDRQTRWVRWHCLKNRCVSDATLWFQYQLEKKHELFSEKV